MPAGDFVMGSTADELQRFYEDIRAWPPSCIDGERPQHRVSLDAFQIDKYPVTCGMYARFCDQTGHAPPQYWEGDCPPDNLIDHPLVYVSLTDAMEYCEWVGGRLPYETEWEKAARGTDGRIYPWGNEFDASKTNADNQDEQRVTAPVHAHPQGSSPYGCVDMVGNVSEWTGDVLTPYPGYSEAEWWANGGAAVKLIRYDRAAVSTNPIFWPNTSTVRGGSFGTVRGLCRCASRIPVAGDATIPDVGFRCVYAPDPNAIGRELMQGEDTQEALRHFRKALELSPAHAGILFNAAYCYQRAEQYPRALELWKKLVEIWPDDQDARHMLEVCRESVSGVSPPPVSRKGVAADTEVRHRIARLARAGNRFMAIKLRRAATGKSLKEARKYVDSLEGSGAGTTPSATGAPVPRGDAGGVGPAGAYPMLVEVPAGLNELLYEHNKVAEGEKRAEKGRRAIGCLLGVLVWPVALFMVALVCVIVQGEEAKLNNFAMVFVPLATAVIARYWFVHRSRVHAREALPKIRKGLQRAADSFAQKYPEAVEKLFDSDRQQMLDKGEVERALRKCQQMQREYARTRPTSNADLP